MSLKVTTCALFGCALALISLQSGCTPVKPWEREHLAKSHMAFDPDPLEARSKQHLYSSKEASSGGFGVAGSGCGCN